MIGTYPKEDKMKRITFKWLQAFALEKGIYVEKAQLAGKVVYEWWKKGDSSCVGVCSTLHEAYSEIYYA